MFYKRAVKRSGIKAGAMGKFELEGSYVLYAFTALVGTTGTGTELRSRPKLRKKTNICRTARWKQ